MRTYRWHLQLDRAFGVQDVVEQAAVVVIACELGLESGLVFKWGCSSGELSLEILRLGTSSNGCCPLQLAHAIVKIHLLAVVVDEGLLLDIGLVAQVRVRIDALFVRHIDSEGDPITGKYPVNRIGAGRQARAVEGDTLFGVCWLTSACGIIVSAASNFEGFRLKRFVFILSLHMK
jgi:hypothetical protein